MKLEYKLRRIFTETSIFSGSKEKTQWKYEFYRQPTGFDNEQAISSSIVLCYGEDKGWSLNHILTIEVVV